MPHTKPPETRELLFSVTIKDCEVQHFSAGGKGGQNQNRRSTGTRVIHHPTRARGEARQERSQHANTRAAFVRMTQTPQFRFWVDVQRNARKSDEQLVAEITAELADPTIRSMRRRVSGSTLPRWVKSKRSLSGPT